ncbi:MULTISPECIES: hypothetical protein [Herbaspirillum]|jgi:type III effector protein AvrPto1|uniref:hypothetical protein n=1 Tax=Herbaspirillum TaxID=963 RepID=UPI0009FEF755|nr:MULTISPECIES: hypothetical protein [Herbaspirillum]MCP1572480.1 type III effector protein AvrPto1 [Herbaspirillum rubrisubalbicans]
MGNFCVGSSSGANAVSSPDHEVTISAAQILEKRNELQNSAGLPQDQYDFVSNQAPGGLRDRYNRLFRETTNSLQMADMQYAFIARTSYVNPEITPAETLDDLNNKIQAWADMREALVTAMESHIDPYRQVLNPSGSRRIGYQTF